MIMWVCLYVCMLHIETVAIKDDALHDIVIYLMKRIYFVLTLQALLGVQAVSYWF